MRLQKYMAKAGVASRRKSEELISQGFVKVNGEIVTNLGYKVDIEKDEIKYKNKKLALDTEKIYIMLNKPKGYITSLYDPHNSKTVIDLIKGIDQRIFPVGRLDKDTEGLLFLTNDGDLTYKLTHPSYEVEKKYLAIVEGTPTEKKLSKLRNGLIIDGKKTSPAKVEILKIEDNNALMEIVIHEGRNRQVRKMCDKIGHPVMQLKRISFGNFELDNLEVGEYLILNSKQIEKLKSNIDKGE